MPSHSGPLGAPRPETREAMCRDLLEELCIGFGLTEERAIELMSLGAVAVDGRECYFTQLLRSGASVAVYRWPKRYAVAHTVDWKALTVFAGDDFCIVDKPFGIPVTAVPGNSAENVLACLARTYNQPFWPVHRLDRAAGGLVVVAASADSAAVWSARFSTNTEQALAQKSMPSEKSYRCLVMGTPTKTTLHHWLAPEGVPVAVSPVEKTGWLEARSEIESAAPFSAERFPKGLYACSLRLLTGRRHQLRAQLAAAGFPIVGDRAYGGKGSLPRKEYVPGSIALYASMLRWTDRSQKAQECSSLPPWERR